MSRKYVLKLFIDTKTKGPFTRVCLNDRNFEKPYALLVRFSLVKYSIHSVNVAGLRRYMRVCESVVRINRGRCPH